MLCEASHPSLSYGLSQKCDPASFLTTCTPYKLALFLACFYSGLNSLSPRIDAATSLRWCSALRLLPPLRTEHNRLRLEQSWDLTTMILLKHNRRILHSSLSRNTNTLYPLLGFVVEIAEGNADIDFFIHSLTRCQPNEIVLGTLRVCYGASF